MSFSFDIRYSDSIKDGPTLEKWLKRKEDLAFYPASDEKEAAMMATNWIGFSRFKASLTATHKNQPVAIGTLFLMPYKKVSHHTLFYLIVGPSYRRKGIGRSMVKNLMNLAQNYFKLESIHCEVFEGSPIIPLLEEMKFEKVLTQKDFVKEEKGYRSRMIWEHFFDGK